MLSKSGMIDETGMLHVSRGGDLKKCACFRDVDGVASCGDWCAGFGEPEHRECSDGVWYKDTFVPICCGTWQLRDFEDKRTKK